MPKVLSALGGLTVYNKQKCNKYVLVVVSTSKISWCIISV